jgi:hypothetical protein
MNTPQLSRKDKITIELSKTARRQIEFIKERFSLKDDGEVINKAISLLLGLSKANKSSEYTLKLLK